MFLEVEHPGDQLDQARPETAELAGIGVACISLPTNPCSPPSLRLGMFSVTRMQRAGYLVLMLGGCCFSFPCPIAVLGSFIPLYGLVHS